MTPQGRVFNQAVVDELAAEERLILLCGHYEGVDERIREDFVDDEVSIGDYVLSGGEVAALVVIDAVCAASPAHSARPIRCWRSRIRTGCWSIRSTRGRRSFAERRFQIYCCLAITAKSPGGAGSSASFVPRSAGLTFSLRFA